MAKNKINENFILTYNSRHDHNNDSDADITINFDNPKDDTVLVARLNTWLKAIGRDNIVVQIKSGK